MGQDPATSVVDPDCRSHDVGNLWIVDASVFPSSAAVNPALTIAANALRVAAKGVPYELNGTRRNRHFGGCSQPASSTITERT